MQNPTLLTHSVNYLLSLDKSMVRSVFLSEVFALTWSHLFLGCSWSFVVFVGQKDERVQLTAALGQIHHHMIWLGVAGVKTWSSVLSWQVQSLSDNRPDGQRTGKGWLGKQHVTLIFVYLSLFVAFIFSDSPCHSPLKCVTVSSSQPSTFPLFQHTEAECSRDFFYELLICCCCWDLPPCKCWVGVMTLK